MKKTVIRKVIAVPELNGNPKDEVWESATTVSIDNFRPEGSDHHPRTTVKLLYDKSGIHLLFVVNDRFVRCTQTDFNSAVCCDSCVEFFARPKPDRGYLNFELNCGGTLLAYYIEDWQKTDNGFKKYTPLNLDDAKQIKIYHSMPKVVEPEISEPVTWVNQLFIPFAIFEKYVGKLGKIEGQTWQTNFYKCGDQTSHPHWASWSPVSELNFHLPQCFGSLTFQADQEQPAES